MLERITIKNLALISKAEPEFTEGLNVLSGETGAGKSILVDAIMLLMGGKYDKTMLSYSADSGFVEGVFSFAEGSVPSSLSDYDAEDGLVVLRKFNASGKNEIKLNGRTVTVGMLKSIMSDFVDICGQNEYQVLSKKSEHAAIVDAFASEKLSAVLPDIAESYAEYAKTCRAIDDLGNAAERERRLDMLDYQIKEIENAAVGEGEEDELSDLKRRIMGGERIKSALAEALELVDGDGGCVDRADRASRALSSVRSLSKTYEDLESRLSAASIELGDICATLSDELSAVDFDPDLLEETENRLAVIRSITRKYAPTNKLASFLGELKKEWTRLSDCDGEYERLIAKKQKLTDRLYELSVKASEIRRENALVLEREVVNELKTLGMEKAKFSVVFEPLPDKNECQRKLTAKGFDGVEFYLSPNLGQPLLPLIKIISGGEMSRFMLALKVISSRFGGVETMIFDEIDTGISGKIGQEVAKKLAAISRSCQVLCVSHLPQIAAMADSHYYIDKSDDGITTATHVTSLSRDGMINEISRLSGGEGIASGSKTTAAELKDWCDKYKSSL